MGVHVIPPHILFIRKHHNYANLKKKLFSHICYFTSEKWIYTLKRIPCQIMGCHYYWICPPVYLYFGKFCIFFAKITWYLSYCLYFHVTQLASQIHSTSTHGRGPLINSHSHRHLTPPLHLQPWKFLSSREFFFLSHALCVYRYNKEKFLRKKMYSLALVFWLWKFRGVTSPLSHFSRTWPLLNWQRHHVKVWITWNRKFCPTIKTQGWFRLVFKDGSAFYTVTRTVLLYQFWEEGGSKPF